MYKFAKLTCLEVVRLYARNHYVFIVLILTQALTVFAFIFFFSSVVSARYAYSLSLESLRTYTVYIKDKKSANEIMEMITTLPVGSPDNARLYFYDGNNIVLSLLHPEANENMNIGAGSGIKDMHVESRSKVAVVGRMLPDYSMSTTSVGDVIFIGNEAFDVVGVRNIEMTEVPYSTALELFDLVEMHLIMPPNLSTWQRDTIVSYLSSNFDSEVTPPRSVLQKTLVSLLLPFIACIFIAILTVLTFSYLQIYMMDKCKRDFSIMKLCGSSFKYSVLIIAGIFIGIFTMSYIFGAIAYLLIYRTFSVPAYLLVYIFFALLLILLLTPNSARFVRKTTSQELQR